MNRTTWHFAIDVGGTFTDVVARCGDAPVRTCKVLSSARTIGVGELGALADTLVDPLRIGEPADFWNDYSIAIHRNGADAEHPAVVKAFDAATGTLRFYPPLPHHTDSQARYVLFSGEPSPVLAMRRIMELRLDQPIGPVDVRLGSTRSTNALLERRGGPAALVTTRGFADILHIGYQNRPKIFELDIRKPVPLSSFVVELDERIAADGVMLIPLSAGQVHERLTEAKRQGAVALAICLLNAYANPEHEMIVERVAAQLGFECISRSTAVSPLQGIVSRGDTTLADAYLSPVIRDYLQALQRHLPAGRLRIMTSAGGLAGADTVSAKDTLLSGPSGGVVGCAAVTAQAGFDCAIGFDMGGTSTDVCRFDGAFEYQFETVKGGVRIVSPMLAVETVAAGGGSICDFDGQKLVVGPQSAGADPGPACYGNGGPLAITDANLLLGRLPPRHFPLPIDHHAVNRRFDELIARVRTDTGRTMSPPELAQGFIRIANENMAAAIRRISTAKGYDPADHVLVCFGGAGGQHACAVATLLGMRRVLLNPHAGVLSAVGIAMADVKRFAERAVGRILDESAHQTLDQVFREMAESLRQDLLADGVNIDDIQPPSRMLDLRYQGEDACITVCPDADDYVAPFERMHRQLYGYVHTNRPIEIVAARLELTATTPKLPLHRSPPKERRPAPDERHGLIISGSITPADVYHRQSLRPGDRFTGPAVVLEPTSTIVVDPDWNAEVLDTGDIVLMAPHTVAHQTESTEADPVRLELFNNRFAAVAERMGVTLRRTALSTNVKQRLDYSCAVFTADGDLVVNAPHMPVHLGSMAECVKAVLADVRYLSPGDVVLTNDPYRGGTHVPDLTCVTPVFDDRGGRIRFFVASRAHHAEIGSPQPGSMPADSKCLADEGIVIRNFKVVDRGAFQTESLRRLLTAPPHPSRSPDENIADIAAQIAANQSGIADLQAVIAAFGEGVVSAYMDHIRRAAETKMRRALHRIPDGAYSFEDFLDDGSLIRVAVTVDGDRAVVDFSGSAAVHPGNFNANRAIVSSAVLYCFRCLIDEDIPLNSGVLQPVEIRVPPGLLNPPANDDPTQCPAVAAGNVETSQRLVDVIFGALGTVAASQGTMNNTIFGNDRFGYYETICGGAGAGPTFDGADAVHTHMTNTRQTDPEVLEARYPVRLRRLQIRRGSGGTGKHRGGDGAIREFEFLEPLAVSIISQRRSTCPYGLAGGSPGASGRNLLRRKGASSPEVLPPVTRFTVNPGDIVTIETPGGGGYGEPI